MNDSDSDSDVAVDDDFATFLTQQKGRLKSFQKLNPGATLDSPEFKESEAAYLAFKQPDASTGKRQVGQVDRHRAQGVLGPVPTLKKKASGQKVRGRGVRSRTATAFSAPRGGDGDASISTSSSGTRNKEIKVNFGISGSSFLDADTAAQLGVRMGKYPFIPLSSRGGVDKIEGYELKVPDHGAATVGSPSTTRLPLYRGVLVIFSHHSARL